MGLVKYLARPAETIKKKIENKLLQLYLYIIFIYYRLIKDHFQCVNEFMTHRIQVCLNIFYFENISLIKFRIWVERYFVSSKLG